MGFSTIITAHARPVNPREGYNVARRSWDSLAESTRKRYLGKGRALGLTEAQVQRRHEMGAPMGVFRGHRPRVGVSEREWSKLVQAAKAAKMREDVDNPSVVLESLLAKGFTVEWILMKLIEKRESRETYRSWIAKQDRQHGRAAGWEPGRKRWFRRTHIADIELYYYH